MRSMMHPIQMGRDKHAERLAELLAREVERNARTRKVEPLPPEPKPKKVYIIGSLRNERVADRAAMLRSLMAPGTIVFDDWLCAGPHADDAWRDHEKARGNSFIEALNEPAAKHVFAFDKHHLLDSDAVVLIAPAGKSAHLELGWSLGKGKPGFILLDDPERWDVMYQFATAVTDDIAHLANMLDGAMNNADYS